MNLALARSHVRIDRRRPASWLAVAVAAAGTAWLTTWAPAEAGVRVAAAIATGALAAVIAIGDPPRGLYGPVGGWVWLRAAWPLFAVIAAGLACSRGAGSLAVPACACVSLVAAAWGAVAAVRGGAMPGDAVSMSLATAAAAAAASLGVAEVGRSEFAAVGGAGATWLATHAAWRAWESHRGDFAPSLSPAGHVGLLPCGPEGRLLFGVAMLSALAGMVGWLFLDRESAGWYRLLAAAWFVVGAVPQATLAAGAADDGRRWPLLTTASGAPGLTRPALRAAMLRALDALRPAAAWAAVLGWPLVVAAVLAPTAAERSDRIATVGGLAAAAGVLAVVTAALRLARANRETVLAVAMILVAGVAVAALNAHSPPARAWGLVSKPPQARTQAQAGGRSRLSCKPPGASRGMTACSGMMLRESGHSCETSGSWQGSPFVRGVVSCKEVHPPGRAVGIAWSSGRGLRGARSAGGACLSGLDFSPVKPFFPTRPVPG